MHMTENNYTNTDAEKNSENTTRRLFTYEERKQILNSTGGICACCGKKLTTKTLTVEHIIPIYRGGTNDFKNLTALCYDCNQEKSDLLFLPRSFYSALTGTQRITDMDNMVREWFAENSLRYDIERYPLIAPKHNCMIAPVKQYRRIEYNRQLIVSWSLITGDTYDTVEAISGVNLKTIRNLLERVRPEADESERHLHPHRETYKPVTFYALNKLSNQKLLAIFAIRYDAEQEDLAIYIIWSDVTKRNLPIIMNNFLSCTFDAICNIGGKTINGYAILSNYSEALQGFRDGTEHIAFWEKAEEYKYIDTISNKPIYGMVVYHGKQTMPVSMSKYISIPRWMKQVDIDN